MFALIPPLKHVGFPVHNLKGDRYEVLQGIVILFMWCRPLQNVEEEVEYCAGGRIPFLHRLVALPVVRVIEVSDLQVVDVLCQARRGGLGVSWCRFWLPIIAAVPLRHYTLMDF